MGVGRVCWGREGFYARARPSGGGGCLMGL